MSVDLGGLYTKVAVVKMGRTMEIALDRDSSRKTVSAMGFKDGYLVFGDGASALYRRNPGAVFFNVYDLLGRQYDSDSVSKYMKNHPHNVILKDEATGGVLLSPTKYDGIFTPTELFALFLNETRQYTSLFLSYDITDVLIAVPPNMDQATAHAIKAAAKIVGINLVGIVDSSRSVATQYIITRKADLSPAFRNVMIVDIGAYNTIATVLSCGLEPGDKKNSSVPSANVTGIGFVGEGVSSVDVCLSRLLIEKFKTSKGITEAIEKDPKVEAKFIKEAAKAKHILTGSKEAYVNVEEAYKYENFQFTVDRGLMEQSCGHVFDGTLVAIDRALSSAKLTADSIDNVVLMGGGSLIGAIQSRISRKTGKESLNMVLNTDDSIALGASFLSADASPYFRVVKLNSRGSVYYPLELKYQIETYNDLGELVVSDVTEHLYPHLAKLTAKKVLTIKNASKDFIIRVRYAKLPDVLDSSSIDNSDIANIHITGVKEAISSHPDYISKHVSVYFRFDQTGTLVVPKVELHFEKNSTEGILSKVGSAFAGLFGRSRNSSEEAEASEATEPVLNNNYTDVLSNETNATESKNSSTKQLVQTPQLSKNKLVVNVSHSFEFLHFKPPTEEEVRVSADKLVGIYLKEKKRNDDAKARSDLEGAIYEVSKSVDSGLFSNLSTSEELEGIKRLLEEVRVWFDENGHLSHAEVLDDKRRSIVKTTAVFAERAKEMRDLPLEVENLRKSLNSSKNILLGSSNMTEYTQVMNLSVLERMVNMSVEAESWVEEKLAEQSKLKPYETPVITSKAVKRKARSLNNLIEEFFAEFQGAVKKVEKMKRAAQRKVEGPADKNTSNATDEQSASAAAEFGSFNETGVLEEPSLEAPEASPSVTTLEGSEVPVASGDSGATDESGEFTADL